MMKTSSREMKSLVIICVLVSLMGCVCGCVWVRWYKRICVWGAPESLKGKNMGLCRVHNQKGGPVPDADLCINKKVIRPE
jgi:hypothetical protein